jgi:hypothetical protein
MLSPASSAVVYAASFCSFRQRQSVRIAGGTLTEKEEGKKITAARANR